MPSVLAHHVVISTHGFWLPNDPRGSCSTEVGCAHLQAFGPATTVLTHRSVANQPHDHKVREAAKQTLKYPEVVFSDAQARSVANGFAFAAQNSGYQIYACCILPQHAHFVIAQHTYPIEQVVRRLRQAATFYLLQDGLHPFAHLRSPKGNMPSVWGQDFWKVFLFSPEDVQRAIEYVEDNPPKEGKQRQQWPFVASYVG
jgi:REP element-mobilizing transposase RayT